MASFKRVAMMAVLAAVLLGGSLLSVPVRADDDKPATITVTGEGKASARPDMAVLDAAAVGNAPVATSAMNEVSEKSRKILKTVAFFGIPDKDVQTSSISLNPQYDRRDRNTPEPPRIISYAARINHTVRVHTLGQLGKLIDALVQAGAGNLGGVRFSVADKVPLADEARRRAVMDAKRTVDALAKAAGVKAGNILSIEQLGGGIAGPRPLRAMALRAEAVPVAAGEVSVTARVRLIVAIGK